MKSINPVIGKRHMMRDGSITKIIVSSKHVSANFDRYPFMELGNLDPVAVWAVNGSWDDRGSEWPQDLIKVIE